MEILGGIAAGIGAVLLIASLILTMRANPDTRIPFLRNALVVPAGSIAMRSIGAGLLVIGAAALMSTLGAWSVVIAIGIPLLAIVLIPIHNSRIAAASSQ